KNDRKTVRARASGAHQRDVGVKLLEPLHALAILRGMGLGAPSGNPVLRKRKLRSPNEVPGPTGFSAVPAHLVVSQSGEAHGFVDDALARLGYRRRIAPTVSSFLQALAALGETDLIAVLPRRPLLAHARAFGLASIDPPFPVPRDPI